MLVMLPCQLHGTHARHAFAQFHVPAAGSAGLCIRLLSRHVLVHTLIQSLIDLKVVCGSHVPCALLNVSFQI